MYCETLNPARFIKHHSIKILNFYIISPILIEMIYAHNEFQNLLQRKTFFNGKKYLLINMK